jgi:hypothetical protein
MKLFDVHKVILFSNSVIYEIFLKSVYVLISVKTTESGEGLFTYHHYEKLCAPKKITGKAAILTNAPN